MQKLATELLQNFDALTHSQKIKEKPFIYVGSPVFCLRYKEPKKFWTKFSKDL